MLSLIIICFLLKNSFKNRKINKYNTGDSKKTALSKLLEKIKSKQIVFSLKSLNDNDDKSSMVICKNNSAFLCLLMVLVFNACSGIKQNNNNKGRLPTQINSSDHFDCNKIVESFFTPAEFEKESFLYVNLLKKSHLTKGIVVPADDLDPVKMKEVQTFFKNGALTESSSLQKRFEVLKLFPIGQIAAAPGHRFLRKPEQIKGLIDYIEKNPYANFGGDKIILNVIIDQQNKVESVDLWNAHHRLVAYMKNGYLKIGDIPQKNIEILVNGKKEEGEDWVHYLPSAGVNWDHVDNFSKVPAGGDIREGTISVSGKFSNYFLGARNSLAQLYENVFNTNRKMMKVGVYFGTFDPIHEGHIGIIKKAIEALQLDEVIIVPNVNPIHKIATPIKVRNEMIEIRIKNENKINLYTGKSDEIIDKFGRNPFFERMIQTYGSTDLFQIIGQDSYSSLLQKDEIVKSNFRKYIVFPRQGSKSDPVDTDKVIVVDYRDEKGLSSTLLKKRIRDGLKINKEEIDSHEYEYILEHGLYKNNILP